MAKIQIPKKSLEPPSRLPAGMVTLRLDGFKPTKSKPKPGKDQSINLNPNMRTVNNPDPELNNKPVFENLNVNAGWVILDFVHAFGLEMVANGDSVDIPGEFTGPDDNPEAWQYQGPLLGQMANAELIETEYNGKKQTKVKRYLCRVPGCQISHSENLVKAA
jgi:hypothetical protein